MSSSNLGECGKCQAAEAVVNYRGQSLCRSCYEADVPSWDRDQWHALAEENSEGHVLFYSNTARILGGVIGLSLVGVGFLIWAAGGRSAVSIGLIVIVGLMALMIIAELFFWQITWNDQEICSHTLWRGRRIIPWQALHRVSYAKSQGGVLVLHSTSSGRITVRGYAVGYNDFVQDLRRLAPSGAVASLPLDITPESVWSDGTGEVIGKLFD